MARLSAHYSTQADRCKGVTTLFTVGVILLSISSISVAVPDFTCFSLGAVLVDSHYVGGYWVGTDSVTAMLVRVLDTGSGDEDLPSVSTGIKDFGTNIHTNRYTFTDDVAPDRFGAYDCVFDPPSINITTIIMSENGDVSPGSPTITASVHENVTITVSHRSVSMDDLRWKHDGNDVTEWDGLSAVTINDVNVAHGGIYECYKSGDRAAQKHALLKLIVRECPNNRWGPFCDSECLVCHNGGMCDDKTGECICAPGFSGNFCEILHGKNCFGKHCDIACSGGDEDGCQGTLMCPPDPFGCTCAAAFTGVDCQTFCPGGFYGAGCKHECHCEGDEGCDEGDGTCRNSAKCAAGYRGENCQNSCPWAQIGVDRCVNCKVPVAPNGFTISPGGGTRQITWNYTSNMCPVSDYLVQHELVNIDQCQPVSGEMIDHDTVSGNPVPLPYSYTWNSPSASSDSQYLPHSTYKIRVRARNEAGLGDYENTTNDQLTTAEGVPTAPPANVESFSPSNDSLKFCWDEVPCGSRRGRITQYAYMLELSTGNAGVRDGTTSGRSLTFDSDILPCSDYTFKVAGKTNAGRGSYSEEIPVTTATKGHGPVANLHAAGEPNPEKLQVTWDSPDTSQNPCSIEFIVEYELINRDQCDNISRPQRKRAGLGSETGITISGLEAHSMYYVFVRTENKAGQSEVKSLQSTTSSKAPTKGPAEFRSTNQTKYSIQLSWSEIPCGQRNAEIVGYSMEYRVIEKPYNKMFQPSEEFTPVDTSQSDMFQHVPGLEPSTKYEFRLAGLARLDVDTPGQYATVQVPTLVETDIEAPMQPSVDSSLTTSSTVTIRMTPPAIATYITDFRIGVCLVEPVSNSSASGGISRRRARATPPYYVTAEFSKENFPDTFTVGDSRIYGGHLNRPLRSDTEYDIYLASVSRVSDMEVIVTQEQPLRVKVNRRDPVDPFPVAAVVVPILLLIILVAVAAGVIYTRRRTRKENRHEDGVQLNGETGTKNPCSLDVEEDAASTSAISSPTPVVTPKTKPKVVQSQDPVPLAKFEEYILKRKAAQTRNRNGFFKDYENLPGSELYPTSVARHEKNREKNRYANIIPYDDSRVVLEKLPGDPYSDYVNASYIDGFNEPKKYIASQGPNKASLADMWRMIWQKKTAKIVMLTNLQEGIKIKCAQYWPDGIAVYGQLAVRLTGEETHTDYIIRDFTLQLDGTQQSVRKVRQFHFTTWPDMGVPHDPSKVINFVKIVKAYNPEDAGTMIVHCSAGVGRTGAFIVLDSMLDQAKEEDKVDVWNFTRRMREKRMNMIQTVAQYEFIFDALLEEFVCGDTAIQAEEFRTELAALTKTKKSSKVNGLQEQFKKLDLVAGKASSPDQRQGGRDPSNVDKNRFPEKIPVDRFRPRLMTEGGEGSTDYINACFLNSHSSRGAYIATQMPLPHTIGDMWRMVYDYNCTCIVMLNAMDDNDPTCGTYWPATDTLKCSPLVVTLESTEKMQNNLTVRYLTLKKGDEDQVSRMICHLQLLDWPNDGVPAPPSSILKLVASVQEWQRRHVGDRVVVHCIDGEGASGTFCALLNILERLEDEKVINVFQAVKKLREARPGVVQSLAQYKFLYAALQAHMDSQSVVYENLELNPTSQE